jgi:AcrR family transcriptional regulator
MLSNTTRIPKRTRKLRRDSLIARKQPAQERSAQTVEAILEAAAHILETLGIQGFNTNAVAAKAGVSIGSLYQYFPGKDALTVALITRSEEELHHAIADAVQGAVDKSLKDALGKLIDVQLAHHARRCNLNRILELEERRLMPGSEAEMGGGPVVQQIFQFLKQHKQEIRCRDLSTAALDCLTIVRALTDEALQRDAGEIFSVKTRILRAVMGYLQYEARS